METAFTKSNEIYQTAYSGSLKKPSHGETIHKELLLKEGIDILNDQPIIFSTTIPTGLLNKVFFGVMLYLSRHG